MIMASDPREPQDDEKAALDIPDDLISGSDEEEADAPNPYEGDDVIQDPDGDEEISNEDAETNSYGEIAEEGEEDA
jgi:hypothetical protein